jgi:hypothetical protein
MLFIRDAMSRGESKEYSSKEVLGPDLKPVELRVLSSREEITLYRPGIDITLYCCVV